MGSRRGEVSAACFVHDGSDTLRRESVEEADVSDCCRKAARQEVLPEMNFFPRVVVITWWSMCQERSRVRKTETCSKSTNRQVISNRIFKTARLDKRSN